jgi:hypothetical protein
MYSTLLIVILASWLFLDFSEASSSRAYALSPPDYDADQPSLLLRNATVFVGDGGAALQNHAILIQGNKIVDVAPTGEIESLPGSTVLDLSGKSVIPGIVGMHNHTHMPGTRLLDFTAPRLYLAAGVTTIQTAGSADADGELELARAIEDGEVPGPRIFASAPYVNGPAARGPMFVAESAEDAREFVNTWADRGVSWFKLYRHTDPATAAVVIDEAHRLGLKVAGHLCSITYAESIEIGIDRLEHGLNPATDFVHDKKPGECVSSRTSKLGMDPDGNAIDELIQKLVDSGVTITSTLAILESGFPHRPQADARSLSALEPTRVKAYEARQKALEISRDNTTWTPGYWDLLISFERRFHAAGGRLVAGPDTGRHVLPGFGDQRNFELLVESGFSIAEVVQIMSHNGALELGIGDTVGLLSKAYLADLVVIDGDLAADASRIRNVEIVFKGGTRYDSRDLIDDVSGQVGLR